MRTIKVYGQLAKELGQRVFRAEVESAAEAVRFLVSNFPHLERHMADQYYRVATGRHIVTQQELHHPAGSDEVISITPVIAGSGAVGRIIVGVLLVAASFFIPGVALFGVALAPIALGIGASLVLGGIAELISPVPNTNLKEKDPTESFSFSGIQNTSRSGLPIPIIYGETVVGSITISAGTTVEDIEVVPDEDEDAEVGDDTPPVNDDDEPPLIANPGGGLQS
jgi:predicted phage tail protein